MKRQTKKILLIAAAALAILVLVAGLIMLLRKDSFGDNYFTRNKAVATVNGTKITKNEFAASLSNYYNNIDTYNMYAMHYGYGKYYDVSSETGMRDLKKDILNNLIESEAFIQMGKELGITLTAEEQSAVAQSAKDALTNLKDQILESAKSSGAQNPETYATTMLANYFSNIGINQKTFLKRSEHSALAEAYAEKIQEHFAAERNVTEAELKDIYAEYAKTYYEDAYVEGAYAQNTSYLAMGYTDIPYLYIPEDFVFVQVIQTSDADKAGEILAKVQEGEDFETYRASDDNESETGKAQAILAIGENDSPFDGAVYDRAKDMNVGDVDMVQVATKDSDGNDTAAYYIVKRAEGTTGIVPYEEVKAVIDDTIKSYAENNYYTEQIEAWRDKANIVVDEDVIQAFDPAK